MFTRAIARRPGRDFGAGITTSNLGAPDYDLVLRQHAAYVRALEDLGLEVTVLDSLEGFPDAYFVEDAAVVLPEIAVVTRPGAAARRGEADAMAAVLSRCRDLVRIEPPGTLDGGDVLLAGRRAFIGISGRTNDEGAKQLGAVLESAGLDWTTVPVARGLHLKSNVNYLGGTRSCSRRNSHKMRSLRNSSGSSWTRPTRTPRTRSGSTEPCSRRPVIRG